MEDSQYKAMKAYEERVYRRALIKLTVIWLILMSIALSVAMFYPKDDWTVNSKNTALLLSLLTLFSGPLGFISLTLSHTNWSMNRWISKRGIGYDRPIPKDKPGRIRRWYNALDFG